MFGFQVRVVALAALVVAGGVGLVGADPAGAAPSAQFTYSTDDGATWSASPTVAPGASLLVRQWFDNDTPAAVSDAQVTSGLPAGFTRVAGSTSVCLNPSTTDPLAPVATEEICAAADESSVWTGGTLAVSPSAGLFGSSAGSTSGTLAAGRKRYFNLRMCQSHRVGSDADDRSTVYLNSTDPTSSNASNVAATSVVCLSAPDYAVVDNSGVQAFDLLGNRYVNIEQCRWEGPTPQANTSLTASPLSPDWAVGSSASNVPDTTASCASSPRPGWSVDPDYSAAQPFDVLENRYISFSQCGFVRAAPFSNPGQRPQFWILTRQSMSLPLSYADNTGNRSDPTYRCGTAPSGWSQILAGRDVVDLWDAARGRGYVTYEVTAPTTLSAVECETFVPGETQQVDQSGALEAASIDASASAVIDVDWSQATGDPCATGSIPVIDLRVAAVVAVLGAGVVVASTRSRRPAREI